MPYQNLSAVLTDADANTIKQKLNEAAALMPFLVNLSKTEKKKAFRLGKKTEKFLFDIQKTAGINPVLVPGYVDMNEFARDFELNVQLLQVEQTLRMMLEAVVDTRYALVQECQKPGLAVYKNIQSAAQANVPGADAALEDLKIYFRKTRKKK